MFRLSILFYKDSFRISSKILYTIFINSHPILDINLNSSDILSCHIILKISLNSITKIDKPL
ncbi:hypothetical protein LSO10F_70035 [Candidatus Liberibacter solanacearum]